LTSQILSSVYEGVETTPEDVDNLGDAFNDTRGNIRRIKQTVSQTSDNVNGLCKTLQAIDKTIRTAGESIKLPLQKSWFGTPYTRNRGFIGRASLMSQMAKVLLPERSCQTYNSAQPLDSRVFSLSGLPGVGKSQVAIEFSYQHQSDFTHIYWISADSLEKFEQGYSHIAKSLGLTSTIAVEDTEKILHLARIWLRNPPEGMSLILLHGIPNSAC